MHFQSGKQKSNELCRVKTKMAFMKAVFFSCLLAAVLASKISEKESLPVPHPVKVLPSSKSLKHHEIHTADQKASLPTVIIPGPMQPIFVPHTAQFPDSPVVARPHHLLKKVHTHHAHKAMHADAVPFAHPHMAQNLEKGHHVVRRADNGLSQNGGAGLINFQVQEVNNLATQNTNNAATVNTAPVSPFGMGGMRPNFGGVPSFGGNQFAGVPMGGSHFVNPMGGSQFAGAGGFPGQFGGNQFGGFAGNGFNNGFGGSQFGSGFGGFGRPSHHHHHHQRPMFF